MARQARKSVAQTVTGLKIETGEESSDDSDDYSQYLAGSSNKNAVAAGGGLSANLAAALGKSFINF